MFCFSLLYRTMYLYDAGSHRNRVETVIWLVPSADQLQHTQRAHAVNIPFFWRIVPFALFAHLRNHRSPLCHFYFPRHFSRSSFWWSIREEKKKNNTNIRTCGIRIRISVYIVPLVGLFSFQIIRKIFCFHLFGTVSNHLTNLRNIFQAINEPESTSAAHTHPYLNNNRCC